MKDRLNYHKFMFKEMLKLANDNIVLKLWIEYQLKLIDETILEIDCYA